MHHHLPPSILAATTAALLLLSAASSSAFFVSALPCPRDEAATDSSCLDASTAGLTAWADADFSGPSYQYNVSWNTCSMWGRKKQYLDIQVKPWMLTPQTASIAADFPLNQAAGVSSLAANAYNWCTVYP